MQAMVLDRLGSIQAGSAPLQFREVPAPVVKSDEVLLQVLACGVCHTELD